MFVFVHIIMEQIVITINVLPSDKIHDIMLKIMEEQKISPLKQYLMYNTMELDETRCLSDYGVREDSVVLLLLVPVEIDNNKNIIVNRSNEIYYTHKALNQNPCILFLKTYFGCWKIKMKSNKSNKKRKMDTFEFEHDPETF